MAEALGRHLDLLEGAGLVEVGVEARGRSKRVESAGRAIVVGSLLRWVLVRVLEPLDGRLEATPPVGSRPFGHREDPESRRP